MNKQILYTVYRTSYQRITCTAICLMLLIACSPGQAPNPAPPTDKTVPTKLRLATFNVAMGLQTEGQLSQALRQRDDPKLRQLAEILQRVRPDIVLLNEFDYDPAIDAVAMLNENYLEIAQNGQSPIHFAFHYRAAVNTGVDSGLDLNGNGVNGEPDDAWGYGTFPGQYGMLVLSRFPIDGEKVRSFQRFRWADLPAAREPMNPDSSHTYPAEIWQQLRLSSKSHWDLFIDVDDKPFHLLAFHPTPPVFDGPEDRNGMRNFDEIRLWSEYLSMGSAGFIVDDQGVAGGLSSQHVFVIAGDFNSDPLDGDSVAGAVDQLLNHPRINSTCLPRSEGGAESAVVQAGVNQQHRGDPANDTADFNDQFTGNFRIDYLLPAVGLEIIDCAVFWPASDQPGHELVDVSDHRLVWLDIKL